MKTASIRSGFPGAIRLFRFAGIDVFLHWTWLLVAVFEIQFRPRAYESQVWNVAEYLTLFLIVLLHEFGHALACRSVGGRANRILLWPLGGVAYVDPPRRPGAMLWSIAAGPLVNVVLAPVTIGAAVLLDRFWPDAPKDVNDYISAIASINLLLLIFNLLPIYPLDGGQIVQSILWYFVGLPRSLIIAASIGLVGAVAAMVFALIRRDSWLIILAMFGASRSFQGLKVARALARLHNQPRWADARCPKCGESPPMGNYWGCRCGGTFDTFAHAGRCPNCGGVHIVTGCPLCHEASPTGAWHVVTP